MLGGPKRDQQQAYRQYVEEAVREGVLESPWDHLAARVVLGDEEFLRQIQESLTGDEREQAPLRVLRLRPDLEQIIRVVEKLKGESWQDFRDRYGDWGRDLAL